MKNTEIVGHQRILGFLSDVVKSGQVAHAYLFIGIPKIGKETIANWFAKQLVNDSKQASRSTISRCPESGLKIADVRSLRHELSLSNAFGGRRVVIMGDVSQMTEEAQNAFLKLLEEPQTEVVFLLLASSLRDILPTIVSRTQVVRFPVVPKGEIQTFLSTSQVSASRAEELARLSRGRPGWAISQLGKGEELSDFEKAASSFLETFSQSIPARFKYVRDLTQLDSELPLESWEGVLRDILLLQSGQAGDVIPCQIARYHGNETRPVRANETPIGPSPSGGSARGVIS